MGGGGYTSMGYTHTQWEMNVTIFNEQYWKCIQYYIVNPCYKDLIEHRRCTVICSRFFIDCFCGRTQIIAPPPSISRLFIHLRRPRLIDVSRLIVSSIDYMAPTTRRYQRTQCIIQTVNRWTNCHLAWGELWPLGDPYDIIWQVVFERPGNASRQKVVPNCSDVAYCNSSVISVPVSGLNSLLKSCSCAACVFLLLAWRRRYHRLV